MIFLVHLTDNSITSLSSIAARETRRNINKPHKSNDGWVFIKKRKVVRLDSNDGRATKNFVYSMPFQLGIQTVVYSILLFLQCDCTTSFTRKRRDPENKVGNCTEINGWFVF